MERWNQRREMCGCNCLGIPAELFREGERERDWRERERVERREREDGKKGESGRKGGKRQIGRGKERKLAERDKGRFAYTERK